MGRESIHLRGFVVELDSAGNIRQGWPAGESQRARFHSGRRRGRKFAIMDGRATWKSPIDAGGVPYSAPAFYVTYGGPTQLTAWLVERLLASPDKSLALLPGGKAAAEKLTTLEIGEGAKKKNVTAWAVSGLSNSPLPMWTDAENKFFGLALGISWLPEAYENERAKLEKAQGDALAARMPALGRSLAKTPSTPVAFTNVRISSMPMACAFSRTSAWWTRG